MEPYRNSPSYLKKCQRCDGSGIIITFPMGCRDEETCFSCNGSGIVT